MRITNHTQRNGKSTLNIRKVYAGKGRQNPLLFSWSPQPGILGEHAWFESVIIDGIFDLDILILLRRFVILRSKATKNLDLVWRSSEILRSLRSLRMTRRMICRSSINFRFNTFNSSQSKCLVGQAKSGESVYQANLKPIDRNFLKEVFLFHLPDLFFCNIKKRSQNLFFGPERF